MFDNCQGYWTFKAVSSSTNEVCKLESSVPIKRILIVWPLNAITLKECCWYPVAWFRFENVPSVDNTVPALFSTCTCMVSKAVVVVVSAVSMCSQKLRVAVVAVEGIVTVCVELSVWTVP